VTATASTAAPGQEPRARRRRTDAGTVLLGIWGVLGFLFLFFPVLVIVAYSFNEGRLLQSYRGFGLGAYRDALTNSAITSDGRAPDGSAGSRRCSGS
jgi:ABC-type sugar transport system permease subunit